MQILSLTTRLNVGGPAIQVMDLAENLLKRGHHVHIIAGYSSKEEGLFFQQEAVNRFSGNMAFVPSLQRKIDFRKDVATFFLIRNSIKEYRFDILHSRMSKAGTIGRFAALSSWPRPKLVHTFHGHTFHSYFGRCKGWLFLQIERFLAKRTDVIIAVSDSQKRELEEYGLKPKKMVVIPLGFDLNKFLQILEWHLNFSHFRKNLKVGIVGRLTDIKNHELFFDFIDMLRQEFFDYTIDPIIIGDGEKKAELESKYLGTFTGWKSREEIVDWYKILDVIVCTSKNEGTPVSLIEAMAAGRPVVSTPVGGVVDLIGECEERGIYLRDPLSAVGALRHSFETGRYKDRIKRAREYVKKQHSLDRLVNDIENLYREEVRK